MLRVITFALLWLALAGPSLAGPSLAHELPRLASDQAVSPPPAPVRTGALPEIGGGDFILVDHTGMTRHSADFRGRYMLVYFGYTQCPYTCGTALNAISAMLDDLGDDLGDGGARLATLFITVDPQHDTPARMARHLANFHPAIIGLTGAEAEIRRVHAAWRIAAKPVADPGAFARLVDHTPMIYLYGPGGELLTLLPPIVPPERMAEIIRGYLH